MKVCLKNIFGPDTNNHIAKTLSKNNTRVLALVIFCESGKKIIRKPFRVLSCVIYTIIDKYVCIDSLASDKSKLGYLKTVWTGSHKHNGMDHNNLLVIGIPDLLSNLLSCHGF